MPLVTHELSQSQGDESQLLHKSLPSGTSTAPKSPWGHLDFVTVQATGALSLPLCNPK